MSKKTSRTNVAKIHGPVFVHKPRTSGQYLVEAIDLTPEELSQLPELVRTPIRQLIIVGAYTRLRLPGRLHGWTDERHRLLLDAMNDVDVHSLDERLERVPHLLGRRVSALVTSALKPWVKKIELLTSNNGVQLSRSSYAESEYYELCWMRAFAGMHAAFTRVVAEYRAASNDRIELELVRVSALKLLWLCADGYKYCPALLSLIRPNPFHDPLESGQSYSEQYQAPRFQCYEMCLILAYIGKDTAMRRRWEGMIDREFDPEGDGSFGVCSPGVRPSRHILNQFRAAGTLEIAQSLLDYVKTELYTP